MKDFDWKKHLIECMESTDYCCLATVDEKGGVVGIQLEGNSYIIENDVEKQRANHIYYQRKIVKYRESEVC